MKKGFSCILLLAVMVLALAGCGKKEEGDGASGKHHVEIMIKDYGKISVELDGDAAPITVENFLKLAKDGFYDGLTFHRIMAGFMMQGGDPNGDGTGGSSENIKGEFAVNGVEKNALTTMLPNDLANFAGTLGGGESMEMVLICEIPAQEAEEISSLELVLKGAEDTATISLN